MIWKIYRFGGKFFYEIYKFKNQKRETPSRIEFCEGLGCDELFSSGVLRTPSVPTHFRGTIPIVQNGTYHPAEETDEPNGRQSQSPPVLKYVENSCGSEQNEAKNIQHDQYQYLHCLSSFSMFRFPRFPRGQGYLLRFSITSNLGIIIGKSQARVGQQIKNRNSVEFLRQTIWKNFFPQN